MSAKAIESCDPIVRRLRQAARNSPELLGAARLYQAILPLVRDADLGAASLALPPERIHELMKNGVPLLSGLSLDLDMHAAQELMLELLGRVATLEEIERPAGRRHFWQRPPQQHDSADTADAAGCAALKSAACRIRCALEADRLDIAQVLAYAATGDHLGLSESARGLELDSGLLWTLARNCLKPALQSWRRQLHAAAQEIDWHRGYCFVCGATAVLGELQDNVQAKHLRCGECGADWPFPILQCLQCGNEDHASRPHFYLDGHSERRVEACDLCHGYHKVITAFTPTEPELLVVEDLLSLHLDYIAQQRGYLKADARYKSPS